MLFSSPDYPLFLIAVFFLYALARWGNTGIAGWARLGVMVLLGDIVFMLVAKDTHALWDPIGGVLLRLVTDTRVAHHVTIDLGTYGKLDFTYTSVALTWTPSLIAQWLAGTGLLGAAVAIGRYRADWIVSDRGQRLIALGFVATLAALGIAVAINEQRGTLDEMTDALVAHGHLAVLFVLGVGLGSVRAKDPRPLGRIVVLFVASSLFYHAWAAAMPGPYRYLLGLLLATIVLDYYLGLWIERTEDPWRRKLLVIVSLCSNLGILVFFKYADFFRLDVLGIDGDRWNLILPAGISFHTFQSLSYTIDVYRKEIRATKSVVQFATFVLFFPQLVAGPIVRAQDLLPQLAAPPPLELHKATLGLFRIVVGLFKKIALADALALSIVDRVFEAPERFSSIEVLAGVFAYALQIYLDFSAYSDIAIGSAQVLGFEMPENFRTPYRSSNLQEFWRRWHISLSTWLRDYLYITLGGSKGAAWRTYANLIITMLLGGLWHGASWAFIVWGALHGFGLAVTRFFQRATVDDRGAAKHLVVQCVLVSLCGVGFLRFAVDDPGTWTQLVIVWLFLTPLWAVLTAWLGGDAAPEPPRPHAASSVSGIVPWGVLWAMRGPDRTLHPLQVAELLRIGMCVAALGFLWLLHAAPSETWIPGIVLVWALALAADIVEHGMENAEARFVAVTRRGAAVILVFLYVCLAWIFFRATSFDNALAILQRIGALEFDHANLVPLVTVSLTVGFICHFFPDGSFRWLRGRFIALPAWAQGLVLAGAALVLRELSHTKIVPFIYFQF
jgi:D-alanyl-lipoteichoic acid acyltransferase DltB (MBOAT superfamily)